MMRQEENSVLVRNLDEKVTEELLYELFLQAGPLEDVRIPQVNGVSRNFGFVVFTHEESVPYAIALLDQLSLYGRIIYLKYAGFNNFQNTPQRGPPPRMHIKDRLGPRPFNNSPNPRGSAPQICGNLITVRVAAPGPVGRRSFDNSPNPRGFGPQHSENITSLRVAPGSVGRRYNDLSMQPTRASKNKDHSYDDHRQRTWSQPMPGYLNLYPSQKGDNGKGHNHADNYSNNNFKHKGRHSSGDSSRKPYEKASYQRDSNRHDYKHFRRSK